MLDLFSRRSSRATPSHYSLNQSFANLICDLLIQSLSINDQKTLTASFSLLAKLLTLFGQYCKHWRKEKIHDLTKKLFYTTKTHELVTVKTSALEAVDQFLHVFPEITIRSLYENDSMYMILCFFRLLHMMFTSLLPVSINYLLNLSFHEDYSLRGKVAIVIGSVIGTCIENHIPLTSLPIRFKDEPTSTTSTISLDSEKKYTELELLHMLVMHLIDLTRQEKNMLCLKMLCIACAQCLPQCLDVPEFCHNVPQLLHTFVTLDDNFWGVKCEILYLLQSFDFTLLEYYERKRTTNSGDQKSILLSRSITQILVEQVLWKYIADDKDTVITQTCATFLKIIPHLNGIQEERDNNNRYFLERHCDEYEARLLKQIISETVKKNSTQAYSVVIRDHELENIVVIMRRSLIELNLISNDKNKLSGLLKLMSSIAKAYGTYDESNAYYINTKKAISSVGHPILSYFAFEILAKMLDFINFSEISNDLNVHGDIVETVGVFCLELAYVVGSTRDITTSILQYLLFLLEVISDLDAKPSSTYNDKQYVYAKKMSGFVFEKLFTNLQRSLRASFGSLDNTDSISILRGKILRSLYFLMLGGHQATIIDNCGPIVTALRAQISKDKVNTILCVQELFAILFSQQNNYYMIDTSRQQSPYIENSVKSSVFDTLFANTVFTKEPQPVQISEPERDNYQRIRTTSLLHSNKSPTILLNHSSKTLTVTSVLEMFEPIVGEIIESFKNTHSHQLQNLILFMLSRMVCANVDFKRLDKDNTLLKHILKLINEMQSYLSDHDPSETLHQIIDFLSVLIFTVKHSTKELEEEILLATISSGLKSTQWSTAVLLRALSPLMIRSYLYLTRQTAPVKSDEPGNYGRKLLEIFMDHIKYSECLSVLTLVLNNVRKDRSMWKRLTIILCDKLVKDTKFDLEVNWNNVENELTTSISFLDSLYVDPEEPDLTGYCRRAYTLLQTELLPTLESHSRIGTPNTPDRIALSPVSVGHESQLNRSLDSNLFKALMIMRFLNNMKYLNTDRVKMRDLFSHFMEIVGYSFEHFASCSISVTKQMTIYMTNMLFEVYNVINVLLVLSPSESEFIAEKVELILSPYFPIVTDEMFPYRMSYQLYSALVSIYARISQANPSFKMKVLDILATELKKTTSRSYETHSNSLFTKITFLPLCHLLGLPTADKQSVITTFFANNEFIATSSDFWNQVLVDFKEPVVQQFIKRFTSDVEDYPNKDQLAIGLVQFVLERVQRYATRHLYLNELRKLVTLVELLPPFKSVLNIFMDAYKEAEHLPLFFHKKIYKSVISSICMKDSDLDASSIFETSPLATYSLENAEKEVVSTMKESENIYQEENVVAKLLARFKPFSEQSMMKYAPICIASMKPSAQKTVIELSKSIPNNDINRLSDVIHCLTTVPQLETFFSFFYEKMEAELQNGKQRFSTFASLATDVIKLIDKHFELSETQDLESSFYCGASNKCFLMQYYCKLVELFYIEVLEENAADTADVDVLLNASLNIIDFVNYQESDSTLKNDWDKFIIHMSKLLVDMITVDSKTKLMFLKGTESVERQVMKIISRTYVITKDEKSRHRQFCIGNLIPFVTQKHLPMIRRAAVQICQHYPALAYRRFLPSEDDMGPSIDEAQIELINVMINEISCDEKTFQALWDMLFDLFQYLCTLPSFDELQLAVLKLITNMLCLVKFAAQAPKKGLAVQQKVKQFGKALYSLLQTVDQYLLKNVKHKMKEKRQSIKIDEVYARAILNGYMRYLDDAIKKHKKSNPAFVKEILKSLTLIMSRNPTLFLSVNPEAYTFQWVYDVYKAAYTDAVQNEDWLIKQYVVLGLAKSYSVLYNQEEVANTEMIRARQTNNLIQVIKNQSGFILQVLQDAMLDPHTRLCANLSILIFIQHRVTKVVSEFLPFLSDNFQKWFLEENQTTHSLKLQIRMIASIIESYPDASTHKITRKAMEALFSLADNSRTPLDVVVSVHEALEHLLANYALSHLERKLIEALTSVQHNSKKKQRGNDLHGGARISIDGRPANIPATTAQQPKKSWFHVRNLSGSTLNNFTSSIGLKNSLETAAKTLAPSMSTDDFRHAASSNNMSRSLSTSDLNQSVGELAPAHRRNSLSKLPVLFSLNAPAQHIQLQLFITGPPTTALTPPPSTSLFSITSPSKQASQNAAQIQEQTVTRVLHKTEARTVARNSHTRKVLSLGLMVTSMYTAGTKQSDEEKEHIRVNVLQLFQQLHDYEMHREAEVLLKFIPQLLEDFFDPEQILPLIYNEYQNPKAHPSLLSLFLRIHLPEAYTKEQNRLKGSPVQSKNASFRKVVAQPLPSSSFGDWIQLSLDTLSLKKPISLCLWGLLNLFICVCMGAEPGDHHQAAFVEIGSVVPQNSTDPLFTQAFLLYGVCFYAFLKDKLPAKVADYTRVLNQLTQYKDASCPTQEVEAWKRLVVSLQGLISQYENMKTNTN